MTRRYTTLITMFVLLLLAAASSHAQSAKNNGFYVYQTSGIIGDQDIYVTDYGIKIENKSSGLITIANSPGWEVLTFHERSRTICKQPLDKFRGYIAEKEFVSTGQEWSKLPLSKTETGSVANINANVFLTPNSFTEKQIKDWSQQFADSKFIKSAKYCVSSDLKIPTKAITTLCRFYGTADKGGLPLEFKYHDLGGNLHVGLITSMVKPFQFDSKIFPTPKDFRAVESMKDLLKSVKSSKAKKLRRRPLL